MSYRIPKVNSLIMRELTDYLRNDVKDPRINEFISITSVDTSSDLKTCKVYVSSFGGKAEKNEVLEALRSCNKFLRGELARKVNLRYTPELIFIWDDSIEHGAKILELMDKVAKEDSEKSKS